MQSSLQRRPRERKLYIYDRRFETSTKNSPWLVTSDLDYNGILRNLSETFSVPPNETFVLVTTQRTIVDAETFLQLPDGATLYMLQKEDQPLEVPTEELICFTPHHDTVVESGTYKYYDSEGKKSLPYALADLVDNALSATVDNTGVRTIEIRMLFDESCGKPAVVVWDNGCGMTSKQLNNWAVYKLSKFKREHGRYESYTRPDHVNRSLNSDMSYFGVGGKQAAFYIGKSTRVITKSASCPDVHELVLSKALFEKKEKNKEDAYCTTILNRKPGQSSHIGKSEDRFLHQLIANECSHQSFTAVVITEVLKEHITFLKESFEVWTRQLAHIYHYYLHGPKGNIQGKVPKSSTLHSEQVSKIDIVISLKTKNLKSPHVVNLRDVGTDLQSLYIKAAVSTFEFKACTNPDVGMVEGILRYHPFLYDRETYPEDPDAPPVNVEEDDENDFNTESNSQKQKKPVFECYWNGRLIPYTTIQEFEWCSQPTKGSKVPAECYNRFSGVLFTDDTFKVTENKLTFIDLDQKLKNKDTIFSFVMKGQKQRTNLQREFPQWLQLCHENYDKQVKFMNYQGTITRTDLQTKKNQHPWATFSSMEWEGKLYHAGDYVKSLKTVPIYNGKVNRFLLFGSHDFDGNVYGPGGQVEINLEPKGLYEKTKIIPLTKLDRSATDEDIKQNIKNDAAKLPDKLQVKWPNGNQWQDNTAHPAGTLLGPIKVMILNKKGDIMSCLPSVGKKFKKLSVVLRLVHHGPERDEEVFSVEAERSPKWNFWFKEISNILDLGNYTLDLITIQTETKANELGERRLPRFKLKFIIKADVVDQFDVAIKSTTLRIGEPFDIGLEFKDRYGHSVEPLPDLKPTLHCRGLDVAYEQVKCSGNIMCIKNVKATGKLKNHLEPNLYDLTVTVNGLSDHSKTFQISLLPGNAHTIQVIPKDSPIKVENGSTVKFRLMIQDEAGNLTATSKMTVRCFVPLHPPANINCIAGVGEHVTKAINVSLTNRMPQSLLVRFRGPVQSDIKEVTRELNVLPSKRVKHMKILKKDDDLELKNKETIKWMAGTVLENLYFELYDEADRKVPITAEVASKITVTWTGNVSQKELQEGKLPNVQIPTKVHTEYYHQVLFQDQSVSISFTIVPIPDVPAGLKAILPKCTARLGQILPECISLELVDQYDNFTKTMTQSCVNEIMVQGIGLDRKALSLLFEESSSSVRVNGVRFTSGIPGPREMTFTFRGFTCNARLQVAAGVPAKLSLVSGQPQFLTVLNGHGIPTKFVLQLCDLWDNPSADRRVVVQMLHSSELNVNTNVSSQPVNAEGQASFTVTSVNGPKGSYELKFKGVFQKDPIPGPCVNLTVLLDPKKPISLQVEYDTTAASVAGEFFPSFLVTVMSEEGKPIMSRQAVSMLYWKGELSRTAPPKTALEFQCCEPKENEKKDIFYFREKHLPEHVGKYTVQFCLRDPKNEIILCSDQIVVNVMANIPMKLAPDNPPPTQVVSYSEDLAKRMLVENITLMIMDQYSNPTGQDLNGSVEICIKNLNSHTMEELPLFENRSNTMNIKLENGKAHISKLAIMKKSPGVPGVTYMVLFRPVLSSRVPMSLDSYEFHFTFSNDEENQKKHLALCRNRVAVKEAIKKIGDQNEEHKEIVKEMNSLLERACQKEAGLRENVRKYCKVDLTENTTIEMVDQILCEKLLEAERILNDCRKCRIQDDHKGPDVLGKVGHLAYVIDDAEAWVISWHIRGDMDCVITTTTTAARRIYDLTNGMQQVMPIDGISASCRRPFSPLPHMRGDCSLFNAKGNPVYAVDVLIYPKDNTNEYRTVFRNLLGNTILIDDLNCANDYRYNVVKCKMMCPTILTRQGERVSAKGKFGGAQNKAPPPSQLEMFGAPPPEHYVSLQKNIDLVKQYKQALEKKLQQIKEHEDTINLLEPQIKKNRESLGIFERQLHEIEAELATPLRPNKRVSDSGSETSSIATKRPREDSR